MKHFFFLFAIILLSAGSAPAQNDVFQNFIEKHKQDQGITYAYLSKDLFEVVTETNVKEKDWKKLHNVIKNIGSLSILAGDSIENALPLYREARGLVVSGNFDELLTVRDAENKVHIWARSEDDLITDLVLLVGAPGEFVLICFAGALELGNIAELSRLFEAGATEELVRSSEAVAVEFSISPNPSDGVFRLNFAGQDDMPVLLSVIDQSGRQISSTRLAGSAEQEVRLNDLPSGNYWIQLKTQKGRIGVKPLRVIR